jgi:hypothetical protein
MDYYYKPKSSTIWKQEITRFIEKLPSPICNHCYLEWFGKTLSKLRDDIKVWKITTMTDFDLKIIKEVYPVVDGETMTLKYVDENYTSDVVVCPCCSTKITVTSKIGKIICDSCGYAISKSEHNDAHIESDIKIRCDVCRSELTDINEKYICVVCKKSFCTRCERPHIPPDDSKIELTVYYEYRIKPSPIWKPDVVRFTNDLKKPLCKTCYMNEFEKGITKLKFMLKNWKIDMVRELDIKITKEVYPEAPEISKYKVVESAHELLKKLGKT